MSVACTASATRLKPDDFLGYWKLDGNFADEFGRHDGTYVQEAGGPAAFVPGIAGKALDLTDGSGYVDLGLRVGPGAKSLSFFVKADTFTPELVWVGNKAPRKLGSYTSRFYLGTFHDKAFWGGGADHKISVAWPTTSKNEFHHYALVQTGGDATGGTLKIYQDGRLVHTTTYRGSSASADDRPMLIGRGGGQLTHPADAVLDDVAIFGRALSESEVRAIAEAGSHAVLVGGRK